MDSSRRSWSLIVATLVLIGGYGAAVAALGTPPEAAAAGPVVVTWFRENAHGVKIYVWTTAAILPVGAFIFAVLHSSLPRPQSTIFLIGAITFGAVGAVQSWFWAGLALHSQQMDPAVARSLLDVAIFWGPVLTGTTTTMIAPVTWLALQRRAGLPFWLGLLGLVAFSEQAIETITIFGTSGFSEPGGAMNLQLGAGLTIAWMLAFALWRGLKGSSAIPSEEAP